MYYKSCENKKLSRLYTLERQIHESKVIRLLKLPPARYYKRSNRNLVPELWRLFTFDGKYIEKNWIIWRAKIINLVGKINKALLRNTGKKKQEKYEEKGNANGLIFNWEVHENELWKNIDWWLGTWNVM